MFYSPNNNRSVFHVVYCTLSGFPFVLGHEQCAMRSHQIDRTCSHRRRHQFVTVNVRLRDCCNSHRCHRWALFGADDDDGDRQCLGFRVFVRWHIYSFSVHSEPAECRPMSDPSGRVHFLERVNCSTPVRREKVTEKL